MSLTPKDPRDRLLADTLHDDWASGPASTMARRAAASARRRRTLRHGAVALGTAAALVALASFTLRREASVPATPLASAPSSAPATSSTPSLVATPSSPSPAPTVAAKPPGYEIVSDEEFFALLRDRPLLVLPEEKGPKKFVVLAY